MDTRILFAAVALAAAPASATTVVTFADPDGMTDVSNERWEAKRTMDALGAHIQQLGDRYIAANDTLRVEVLDIDLAGWTRWSGRDPSNRVRIARGSADFPSMRVRYTLESGGRTRTGEARLSDLAYMHHGYTPRKVNESYYYEKKLLEDWFKSTFAEPPR